MNPGRWFTKGRFTLQDLLYLVAYEGPEQEAELRLVFEWYHGRMSTFIRGAATAAAAVPAAFVLGSLKGEADVTHQAVLAGVVATIVLSFAALFQNHHLSHLHREYLLCLRLLDELSPFAPAIRAHFRDAKNDVA